MQDKLEIHIIENPVNHDVKITKLIGPRSLDLPLEGGFYIRPASGRLILVRPAQRPLLVLKEGMYLSSGKFREIHEFIIEIRAALDSPKTKTVKIEVEKPVNSQKVKVDKRKNTGIQVTVVIHESPLATITHIQALLYKELPSKYLTSNLPKVWQDNNKLFAEHDLVLLEVGCTYRLYYIQGVLEHIRLAGEHLAIINRKEAFNWISYQTATFKDGKLKSFTK